MKRKGREAARNALNLQNIKTQKLTKTSENNKANGLTYVNQGVQIHNIWHSSVGLERLYLFKLFFTWFKLFFISTLALVL
jgi:hypothetical protein